RKAWRIYETIFGKCNLNCFLPRPHLTAAYAKAVFTHHAICALADLARLMSIGPAVSHPFSYENRDRQRPCGFPIQGTHQGISETTRARGPRLRDVLRSAG